MTTKDELRVIHTSYFVVEPDNEDTWEQITIALDTYEEAKSYINTTFCSVGYKGEQKVNSVIDIIQRHRNLHDLFLDFLPRGSADVATLGRLIDDWMLDTEELSLYIQDTLNEQEIRLQDADVVALCYEFILSQVQSEIKRLDLSQWDKIIDLNMMVAGNYICTCFDGHNDVFRAYRKAIKKALDKGDSYILEMFLERVV